MGGGSKKEWRAVDLFAWATAGAVLTLLLTTNCDTVSEESGLSDVTCSVSDGDTSEEDTDAEPDTNVSCVANDTQATASGPSTEAIVNGSDAEASAGSTQTTCYEAGEATPISVSFNITNQRFEKFCPGREGFAEVASSLTLTKNGDAPLVVFDGSASIGCDDADVTDDGFLPCAASIPGVRYFCNGEEFFADVMLVDEGDTLEAVFTGDSHALLPGDAIEGDTIEVRSGGFFTLSANNLASVPCPSGISCQTNDDCTTPGDICLDDECLDLSFGSDLTGTVSIDPDPVFPGGSFSASVTFDAPEGDLLPIAIVASVSDDALDVNPGLSAGQVAGGCSVGAIQRFLVATTTPNELFLDVNNNATFDSDEPSVTYGDDGNGDFVLTADVPPNGLRTTLAADVTVTCNLQTLFLAGAEGTYPIHVEATSLDPDNGDIDDGAGLDPLTFTSDSENLVIGEGGPSPTCGDPVALTVGASDGARGGSFAGGSVGAAVSASDALFVLFAAIGLETCELCVCDVDNSGGVSATDALAILRAAVGQPVSLNCPAC